MIKVFDAVVIGAGVNGSSAALHLAKYGKKTALVEQFPLPHTRGSSTGHSRIIRYANYGHESLCPIIIDSYKQWRTLERETQMDLLCPCPFITICKTKGNDQLKSMQNFAATIGGTPIIRSGKSMNDEYKTSFVPESEVLVDPQGGILQANKCLQAIQKRFCDYGGTILDSFPVTKISVDESGLITIQGQRGIVHSKYLIICAGPWASKVLGDVGVHLSLRPLKIQVYYWRMKDPNVKPFTFVNIMEEGPEMYGLPSNEYPGLYKLAIHDGIECDPEFRDIKYNTEFRAKLCRYVRETFPFLDPEPVVEEPCMYTMSPDEEMILDYHPAHKNIVYACGFSGTGFKTGPTVGQILSEMVLGLSPSFDSSSYRSDRFKSSSRRSKL